jgi:acetolactate synthase-1/2/3 large subunit
MNASELMVQCLEAEGIQYIFGVPGEENADFMIALEKSGKIKFILTRHEQGAAFMADIYGRLTGQPAGCLGTLGPGASNLITGVADANMDRAPMLVLTGQGDTERLHKESHQVMDVVSMFKPVTKWATTVLSPSTIPEIIRKAVRVARSEKPGAVLIELPEDVAAQSVDKSIKPLTPKRFRRSCPSDELVQQAVQLIAKAKRPVILAGNGCIRTRASANLREFCELTHIGAMCTFMAKGCVDMDAEYCLYTIGLGARDRIACAIESADLVISLGFDMVEYHPKLWNPSADKSILHVDFLPAEIDRHYHPDLELIGDLADALAKINACIHTERKQNPKYMSFAPNQHKAVRSAMSADFEQHAKDTDTGPIRPQKALWDARQVMGPKDILLSDVGAHKMWVARHYQCHEPNTCLISNGFCSMGFALPGGIAAAMLYPDRRVLAVCGDAGFMMNVQEMETATRYKTKLTAMIWEDKAYGLIAWKQQNHFGHHTKLDFDNPDWLKLADAFGWDGYYVKSSADLRDALEESFSGNAPSLLVVPIDYRENMQLTKQLGEIVCPI